MLENIPERELDYLMARLGISRTRDHKRHMRGLLQAMSIFEARDKVREGGWKEFGASDSAHHCRSKASRLLQHAAKLEAAASSLTHERVTVPDGGELPPPTEEEIAFDVMEAEALDDAYDLVNYAVFFAENVRERRLG